MNLVGIGGKGESVWLGFFLCEVLRQFGGLARAHGDADFAERCDGEGARLRQDLEFHAWDGAWYRRGYFDDGTPLGSASSAECQLDSISQSWSVLSGAGDTIRSRRAMQAVDQRLVRQEYIRHCDVRGLALYLLLVTSRLLDISLTAKGGGWG